MFDSLAVLDNYEGGSLLNAEGDRKIFVFVCENFIDRDACLGELSESYFAIGAGRSLEEIKSVGESAGGLFTLRAGASGVMTVTLKV